MKKISIIGSGYVGLSNAILLSQSNNVHLFDINKEKIDMVNKRISPIADDEINEYFKNKKLNLIASSSKKQAYVDAEFVIIATPTNYNPDTNYFDTSSVEMVIDDIIKFNPNAKIIIKSTIPVGFTKKAREKFNYENIYFSPEFLREGKALYDNLYPSRIIVGDMHKVGKEFSELMSKAALKKNIEILLTESTEAEAIKLFANTFLAMRISYFNELDTYAEINDLSSKDIIKGISLDPRIGDYYNNPSFGYGGYCLPKDTKQLLSNFENIPQKLISAIVDSNSVRKDFIKSQILKKSPKRLGIFGLTMKSGSDNFRSSAIIDILNSIQDSQIEFLLYEPNYNNELDLPLKIINSLNELFIESDLIIANRFSDDLVNFDKSIIYTRDIFKRD
tara:strand:+ start:2373 stop:3545 length:1173 start_codon:yes stop_codon:yes gene_type:complete